MTHQESVGPRRTGVGGTGQGSVSMGRHESAPDRGRDQAVDAGRRRALKSIGATAIASAGALMRPASAQAQTLNVGVLLPRSGLQAFLGQSSQRGADIALAVLAELGYPVKLNLIAADTESNVDVARARAERLINDGAHLLIGAFDSGQTAAIAQVAEQRGVPLVVNIAAAPQITEQGYKHVFRNFYTAPNLIRQGLTLMKDLFTATGRTPKTAVFMHVSDTFGQANRTAIDKLFPTLDMPFEIVSTISYDPATKDLSLEVAKAKAARADILMLVPRLNDAILMVREMVKQRWEPMGIISPGSPGLYEQQFLATLGKYAEYATTNIGWYNPRSELAPRVLAQYRKRFPNDPWEGHSFNAGFTFEAILVAADAFARAKSTNGTALVEALRATRIEKHLMTGGPIEFDAKGQNNNITSVVLQNQRGAPRVVLPGNVAESRPVFPVPAWTARG